LSVDPVNLLAILVMARDHLRDPGRGPRLADRLRLTGRARAAFDAIPPAVLVAVIAPMALATGWRETLAAAATALAATRLPLLGTIAVGVGVIVGLRALA
jgi:uncharacterized membrane protein